MNKDKTGFYISRVVVSGPAKPDADLSFTDGLNVVSGASDTGKSFALSCIDFALGARSAPRDIPEVNGYRMVSLHLITRAEQDTITIERALAGGDVHIQRKDKAGEVIDDAVVPFKHNAKDASTLSGVLLQLTGLWGRQIRKNAKGERRSLSFRDVAYLSVVDEERIIAERPPHLSDSYTERTGESEVFRTIVTGNESGEVIVVAGKQDGAAIDAKLELVASMIETAEADFKTIGIKEAEIGPELQAIEVERNRILSEYEQSRQSVAELEGKLKETSHSYRTVQARITVVEGLIKRFQLLKAHYNSNIQRLAAIEETGSLLTALPSEPCLVCGAPPEAHNEHNSDQKHQPAVVQAAATSEAKKVRALNEDLTRVLDDLISENQQLQPQSNGLLADIKSIQTKISEELAPRVAESGQQLVQQNSRRDILLRGKAILENIARLRYHSDELESKRSAPKSSSQKIPSTASTAEMDDFAQTVQLILDAWKYPNPGRVIFSESGQDLIIGGHSRASHGKGVRALTCAAFILGIMKHCRAKTLPHPSFVVLDSPLVAYREPDSAEGQQLQKAGVKEAFYSTLASGLADGQVIVFENDDPPSLPKNSFTSYHFTKSNTGRYGFFPSR